MGIKLQSIVPIHEGAPKIDYDSKVLLMGSCFSESIGDTLKYYKFDVSINPFGIIFNPVSLEKLVTRAISGEPFKPVDVFEHQDIWKSFEVHSKWSHADRAIFINDLNTQRKALRTFLEKATHAIFTLGTAWVYRHRQSKSIVANCHKIPAKEFTKELLSVEDVKQSLGNMVKELRKLNPSLKIMFTLSPVRHLKDGFVENNQSKARLIDALQQIYQINQGVDYFPSYEIVMDELRDYRFYKKDLVHPNDLAVEYIWEKFKRSWIQADVFPLMEQIMIIRKSQDHKPFHPDLKAHKEFQESLSKKIEQLQKRIPGIRFD